MSIRYGTLLRIQVEHPYAPKETGICLKPTAECLRTMNRLGLVYRAQGDGLRVAFEGTNKDPSQPIRSLVDDFRLTFTASVRDPQFFNYTDLPLTGAPCLFFGNRGTDSNESGSVYLTKGTEVSALDLIAVRPRVFDLPLDYAGPVTVVDSCDRSFPAVQVSSENGRHVYRIDVRGRRAGPIDIHTRNEKPKAIYADDEIVRSRPLGIVEIASDAKVASKNRPVTSTGAVRAVQYKINFAPRKMKWRYFIFTKADASEFKVEAPSALLGFGPGKDGKTDSGKKAVILDSLEPIPLQNAPIPLIRLKQQGKVVVHNLPSPGTDQLILGETKEPAFWGAFVSL